MIGDEQDGGGCVRRWLGAGLEGHEFDQVLRYFSDEVLSRGVLEPGTSKMSQGPGVNLKPSATGVPVAVLSTRNAQLPHRDGTRERLWNANCASQLPSQGNRGSYKIYRHGCVRP